MNTGMAGVYMICGFAGGLGAYLFCKIIGMLIADMTYRNNRD